MGSYNTVSAPVTCPRCGALVTADIEVRFGDTSKFVTLKIGDTVPWVPGRVEKHGGRPEGGHLDGDGYMECPNCGKDSFLTVSIRGDAIEAVTHRSSSKAPYIPD
jgi:ribosomal protein S27AE